MLETLELVLAIAVGVLSTARLTRLVTQDTFPPSIWLRIKWDTRTQDTAWNPLLHCHWCFAPWAMVPVGLWGVLSDMHWSWWMFNGWLAGAYLASMIVERDEVG